MLCIAYTILYLIDFCTHAPLCSMCKKRLLSKVSEVWVTDRGC